jgi:hypothetical protein
MTDATNVSQFMVRNVVDAKAWHPVSYVRQQMLTHAFSYLPIWYADAWKLIPECAVAPLLRNAPSNAVRKQRLAALVSDTVAERTLELLEAPQWVRKCQLRRHYRSFASDQFSSSIGFMQMYWPDC